MLRTKNNRTIVAAILAVARAHAVMPGVSLIRSKALAHRLNATMLGTMTAECVIALCIVLLGALGLADQFDESNLRPQ